MIETISEAFRLFGFGFWVLITIGIWSSLYALDEENYVILPVIFTFLALCYIKPILGLDVDWSKILIGFIVYLILGVIWSGFRWYRFIQIEGKKIISNLNISKGCNLPSLLDTNQRQLGITYHWGKVAGWIIGWPWNMFWTLTRDFFVYCLSTYKGIYQKIAILALSRIK